MNSLSSRFFLLVLAFCLVLPAYAQDHGDHSHHHYLSAFLADFEGSSDKLNQLAEAFSDEQYAWRPAEGIRSVSEVFVHVANANFALSAALGYSVEEGHRTPSGEAEQTLTARADVLADLKHSQEHVREAVETVMGKDLSGEVTAFGQRMTHYQVLMIIGGHSHEHLGQAIAYARSIGVVPPWSGG